MKIKPVFILLTIALAVLLTGCVGKYTNRDGVNDSNIAGKHQVYSPFGESQQLSGSFSGNMFSISGSQETGFYLSFSWSPRQDVYIETTVSKDKFQTIIDENQDYPVIEFVFLEKWLNRLSPYTDPVYGAYGYPYPEEVLRNPNSILSDWGLINVYVYINSEDYANEPYLPGPR